MGTYAGLAIFVAPLAPLSDVTSIRKIIMNLYVNFECFHLVTPTLDGKMCALPYKIGNLTWDMYFCNKGYCPTTISSNSTCVSG